MLEEASFDVFCEGECAKFYHSKLGRPSLAPGVYFRTLLIGFFEGIGSERGIAWRMADRLSLRRFLKYGLNEAMPDHVTISRTRRLIDEKTHQAVFTFVLGEVAQRGLLKGKTILLSDGPKTKSHSEAQILQFGHSLGAPPDPGGDR